MHWPVSAYTPIDLPCAGVEECAALISILSGQRRTKSTICAIGSAAGDRLRPKKKVPSDPMTASPTAGMHGIELRS